LNEDEQHIWANVFVDSENTDRPTPLADYALPVGGHTITVMKSGYSTLDGEKSVAVSAGFEKRYIRLTFHIKKNR
ncbi:MAG: hypothetical protein ACE5I1_24190, partial [bacterium]